MSALLAILLLQVPDAGVPSHPLEGVWKLDLEKSTDTEPILESLGMSWFVRKAAKSVRPVHRIRMNEVNGAPTLFVEIDATVSKKRFQLVLDGKTPTDDEFFGDAFSFTTQLEKGVFVSKGRMKDEAKKAGIGLRRELLENGLMRYQISLLRDGKEPIVIDRIFQRVK